MATSNSFVSAARGVAGMVNSGKGELFHSSTGVKRLDAFGMLNRQSDAVQVSDKINEMWAEALSSRTAAGKMEAILDIFRIMIHKRAVTRSKAYGGEGERKLFYLYFLRLYDDFPKTMICLIKADVLPYYGYWKDYRYIWGMICETHITHDSRFAKYDPLISAMRDSILRQRTQDLSTLRDLVKPSSLSNMSTEDFKTFLEKNPEAIPDINMCGKFCVREKGADNKKLFWYSNNGEKLIIQPHTSYMVRASLKSRDDSGQLVSFPTSQSVPFAVLRAWRQANSKLNTALGVVENYMSAKEFSKINPSRVTSINNSRYMKAFLNEARKGKVDDSFDETGNRHPDDVDRIACRKNFREVTKDPSKINAANLFPHQISTNAYNERNDSTAKRDYNQALWDALVMVHTSKLEDARKSYEEDLKKGSAYEDNIREALLAGNFIGVADCSGSMGGLNGNQPRSVAVGMTAFCSEVAAAPFRNLAMAFSADPYIHHFGPNADGTKMSLVDRMAKIQSCEALNTDYYKMHCAIANLCVKKCVKENDMPIIVVFTDGAYDSFDSSYISHSSYNYHTGRYESRSSTWNTTHDKIRQMYVSKGFKKVPTIVTWDLSENPCGKQDKATDKGFIQLQGQSPSLFKYIMYGEGCGEVDEEIIVDGKVEKVRVANVDQYMVFRKAMDNHSFFEPLLRVLDASSEKELSGFKLTQEMVEAFV